MSEQTQKGRYLRVPLSLESYQRIQQMSYARNIHLNRLATELLTTQIDNEWAKHEQEAKWLDPDDVHTASSLFSAGGQSNG